MDKSRNDWLDRKDSIWLTSTGKYFCPSVLFWLVCPQHVLFAVQILNHIGSGEIICFEFLSYPSWQCFSVEPLSSLDASTAFSSSSSSSAGSTASTATTTAATTSTVTFRPSKSVWTRAPRVPFAGYVGSRKLTFFEMKEYARLSGHYCWFTSNNWVKVCRAEPVFRLELSCSPWDRKGCPPSAPPRNAEFGTAIRCPVWQCEWQNFFLAQERGKVCLFLLGIPRKTAEDAKSTSQSNSLIYAAISSCPMSFLSAQIPKLPPRCPSRRCPRQRCCWG